MRTIQWNTFLGLLAHAWVINNVYFIMEHIFGVIGTCMGTNEYCIMEHFFEVFGTCMGNIAYSIMGHILSAHAWVLMCTV